MFHFLKKEKSLKLGDVVVGRNTKTRKPIVLSKKDRSEHVLVLGGSRSGKTTQFFQ